jgi:hypothetical protein
VLTGILVVASCVLAPIAGLAVFTRNRIINTDRYVATVAPLAEQQPIIEAVARDSTNRLFASVDIERQVEQALPSPARFLAAPVTDTVKQFIRSIATRVLESSEFRAVWTTANRVAHGAVVRALTGRGRLARSKVLTLSNGKVYLDLSPIVAKLRRALASSRVSIFASIPASKSQIRFELFDAKGLEEARSAVDFFDHLASALFVLVFALAGLAVVVSPDRRRTLFRWGLGFAGGLVALLAVIGAARSVYLNAVTGPSLPRDAAAAVYDTILKDLRFGLRSFAAFGLVVALVAYLVGPSRGAQWVRRTARTRLSGSRPTVDRWLRTSERFAARYRTGLRVAGGLTALALVFVWSSPTWVVILGVAAILTAYLAVVEALARRGLASERTATP